MMGNQNCHAEITFEDSVKWLGRFRLVKTSSPPQEVRDWIVRSEATTMIHLQHTSIPTPKIFDWACESDPTNPIGVSYILMEKLNGKSLDWQEANSEQKEKVMQQLADIFLEIEKYPFEKLGSLGFAVRDTIEVQGLAHQATFQVGRGPLGPFSSSLEGSKAILNSYLTMIANGEIDARCPVDTYLVHRFRLDVLEDLWGDTPSGQFFLKHPDDKGDHILVNESFDIVGIIDWEWSQTVSKAEAFSSPCMMWPLEKFYEGSNELGTDELRLASIFRGKGREDLAKYVVDGRKVQRFFFSLGTESSFLDMETLHLLFSGLQRAFSTEEKWGLWKKQALEDWKDDKLLCALIKLE
ncbi:hypothetical protein NUU61_009913 [Penicillium alfredii]|uniref:Aminoglycoside phosphotransferase domain-containing protein n=1 Tax=Penicillium alfredii TaxID=1506179 RepID=A0A9W9EH15_9EURO|nr:uncharacterized protein NUU61_009913 [Penicillium alfredii]KAJ5081649.1 hypothetical protein NUU61_009913 [Penicillium alfredii]